MICLIWPTPPAAAEPGAPENPLEAPAWSKLDFYRPELLARYELYAESNPGMEARAVVIRVNIGLDRPFYEDVRPVEHADGVLILCDKYHRLDDTYAPGDLTNLGGGMYLRAEAAAALLAMQTAMAEDGLGVTVRSAFRSFENQAWIYKQSVSRAGRAATEEVIARAGHSEHQSGLAVDIVQARFYGAPLSSAGFQETEHYAWLTRNAWEYGFILRYPEGGRELTGYSFEPWHWRYVGVAAAVAMRDANIATFDEYYAGLPKIH